MHQEISPVMPRTARILAAVTLAGSLTLAAAGTAGAVDMAPPTPPAVLDHAIIVTFELVDGEQIPTAVEPAPPSAGMAYERMLELRDKLADGCGTHQLDHFPAGLPVPVIGQAYPRDTPGAISAIPNIVGTGAACVTDDTTTSSAPPNTEAPTSTPTTAPPATDATTTIPAPLEAYSPTTTGVDTPAPAVPADASASVVEAVSVRTAPLPLTGSHSGPLVALAAVLMAAGATICTAARKPRGRRI
jgi:hypothetical protein